MKARFITICQWLTIAMLAGTVCFQVDTWAKLRETRAIIEKTRRYEEQPVTCQHGHVRGQVVFSNGEWTAYVDRNKPGPYIWIREPTPPVTYGHGGYRTGAKP